MAAAQVAGPINPRDKNAPFNPEKSVLERSPKERIFQLNCSPSPCLECEGQGCQTTLRNSLANHTKHLGILLGALVDTANGA